MKREFNPLTDTALLPGTQLVGKIIKFDRPKIVTYLKVKSQSIKRSHLSLSGVQVDIPRDREQGFFKIDLSSEILVSLQQVMNGCLLRNIVECPEIISLVYDLRKQGGAQELFVDMVLKEFAE
jgi:hypothetical protein